MKTETLIATIAITPIIAPFTQIWVLLILTAIIVICDWLAGVSAAGVNGELKSSVGIKGICKKLMYGFIIIVAMALDILIAQGLPLVGIQYTFAGGTLITAIVCVWLILNELISILENMSRAGIPLPTFLEKIIKEIKEKVDNGKK